MFLTPEPIDIKTENQSCFLEESMDESQKAVECVYTNKKCYILKDEIDQKECNELIMDYLDYMGIDSTLRIFHNELEIDNPTTSWYSGKLDSIFSLLMKCEIFEALDIIKTLHKDFIDKNNILYVKILTLKFLDYIKEFKVLEAVEFSQKYFIEYIGELNKNEFVEDILMLLAFNDPFSSPNKHYLSDSYKSTIAHEVCVTIAKHVQIKPKEPNLVALFRSLHFTEDQLENSKDKNKYIEFK